MVFQINLIPLPIESFDSIIAMDRLAPYHAKILCYKKVLRLSLPNAKIMIIYGDKSGINVKLSHAQRI